jgi:hypothetical protein
MEVNTETVEHTAQNLILGLYKAFPCGKYEIFVRSHYDNLFFRFNWVSEENDIVNQLQSLTGLSVELPVCREFYGDEFSVKLDYTLPKLTIEIDHEKSHYRIEFGYEDPTIIEKWFEFKDNTLTLVNQWSYG